jgi:hypothetical protein
MSLDDVKDRTSSTVGSQSEGGILFDETITAFSLRRKAAHDFLVGALAESHQKAFRAYSSRAQWMTISDVATPVDISQLAITPELDEPLRVSALYSKTVARLLTNSRF